MAPPNKKAKDLLSSFGNTISAKELKTFTAAGFSPAVAKDFARSSPAVSFNPAAQNYYQSTKASTPAATSSAPSSSTPASVAKAQEFLASVTGSSAPTSSPTAGSSALASTAKAKDVLASFGPTITSKELQSFVAQGFDPAAAKAFVKNSPTASFNPAAQNYYQSTKASAPAATPDAGTGTGAGAPTSTAKANKILASFGPTITSKELQSFVAKGFDPAVAKAFVKGSPAVSFNPAAKNYYQSTKAPTTPTTPDAGSGGGGGFAFPQVNPEDLLGLTEAEQASKQAIAAINADAQKEVARLYSDAQVKSTGLSSDATKYVSDREKEAILRRAEIESQGRLDLQSIINSGMKDVAEIEGLTQRDTARITGEYGVKQEETRQRGQKDIAVLGARSNMWQGVMSMFNF